MNFRKWIACASALGGLIAFGAPVAGAQHGIMETVEKSGEQERLADLIERLEIGMSALEDLQQEKALEMLADLTTELRQERARLLARSTKADLRHVSESASDDDLQSMERRIEILRYAREAFVEAGSPERGRELEKAIYYGDLVTKGAGSNAELKEARAAVPPMGQLVRCLDWATGKYREWGQSKRSDACAMLADYYRQQIDFWGGEEAMERARSDSQEPERSIEELDYRLEVLGIAYGAFQRSGDEESSRLVGRFIRAGELQRDGADAEAIRRAFEGLSMETTIELLQKASAIYRGWGRMQQASVCQELAEFYALRDRRMSSDESDQDGGHREWDFEDRTQRMEVLRIALEAYADAGREDVVRTLEKTLLLAELQHAGASEEQIGAAAEGLSMELIVRLVMEAVDLHEERGRRSHAMACASLGNFYMQRMQSEGSDHAAEQSDGSGHEHEAEDIEAELQHVLERLEAIQEEVESLRESLIHLLGR